MLGQSVRIEWLGFGIDWLWDKPCITVEESYAAVLGWGTNVQLPIPLILLQICWILIFPSRVTS